MGKALIIKGEDFSSVSLGERITIGSLDNNSNFSSLSQSTAFYTTRPCLLQQVTMLIDEESISDFSIYQNNELYKTIKQNLSIPKGTYTLDFSPFIEIPANSAFGFTNVSCRYRRIQGNPELSDGYSSDFNKISESANVMKNGIRQDINWGMEAVIYII